MNSEDILNQLKNIDVIDNMRKNTNTYLKENTISRDEFCDELCQIAMDLYKKERADEKKIYSRSVLKNLFSNSGRRNLKLLDIDLFCKIMRITPDELLFNAKPHEVFARAFYPLSDKSFNNLIKLFYNTFDLKVFNKENAESVCTNFISSVINSTVNEIRLSHDFLNQKRKFNARINCIQTSDFLNDFNQFSLKSIKEFVDQIDDSTRKTYIEQIVKDFLCLHTDLSNIDLKENTFRSHSFQYNKFTNYDIDQLSIGDYLYEIGQSKLVDEIGLNITKYKRMCGMNAKRDKAQNDTSSYWNDDVNPSIEELMLIMSYLNISLTELMYKEDLHRKFEYIPGSFIKECFDNFVPADLNNDIVEKFLEHKKFSIFIKNKTQLNILNLIIYNLFQKLEFEDDEYILIDNIGLLYDEKELDKIEDVFFEKMENLFEDDYFNDCTINLKEVYLDTYKKCEIDLIRMIEDVYDMEF